MKNIRIKRYIRITGVYKNRWGRGVGGWRGEGGVYRLGSSRARDAMAMAPARWMAVSWGYFCKAVMTHSIAPFVTSLRVLPLWT